MYCNPPPVDPAVAGNTSTANFAMMDTSRGPGPARTPQQQHAAAPSIMVGAGPPLGQHQQQQASIANGNLKNGRVSFHDTRMEVRVASLACLSEELRNDIWYSQADIESMRTEARDLCRYLRVHPHACGPEHTRGLELRISLQRQCRKQLTVQGVVEAQKRCREPGFLACLALRCAKVPRDLALAQAQRDYCDVYSVSVNAINVDNNNGNAASLPAAFAAQAPSSAQDPAAAALPTTENSSEMVPTACTPDPTSQSRNKDNPFLFSLWHVGQHDPLVFHQAQQQQQQPSDHYYQYNNDQLQQQQHDGNNSGLSFDPMASPMPCNGDHQQSHYQHTQRQQHHIQRQYTHQQSHYHQQQQQQQSHHQHTPQQHQQQSHTQERQQQQRPLQHPQKHQSHTQQQPHNYQNHSHHQQHAVFDDGNGKRPYDNNDICVGTVEDPQDRMVRRRLEGYSKPELNLS